MQVSPKERNAYQLPPVSVTLGDKRKLSLGSGTFGRCKLPSFRLRHWRRGARTYNFYGRRGEMRGLDIRDVRAQRLLLSRLPLSRTGILRAQRGRGFGGLPYKKGGDEVSAALGKIQGSSFLSPSGTGKKSGNSPTQVKGIVASAPPNGELPSQTPKTVERGREMQRPSCPYASFGRGP